MTNSQEGTLTLDTTKEEFVEDYLGEGSNWAVLDEQPQAQGRVGRVKWATKRWSDEDVTWYLFEVAVLAQDGTVLRMREKNESEAYITDRLLRVVHQHA